MGVRLPGRDSGCLLAAAGRLGAAGHAGGEADDRRVADGTAAAASGCGAAASLRPRRAVRRQRLRRLIEAARNHHQHEPQSQPLRQCQSGIFHEDAEVRRGLPLGVPRSGRSARFDRVLSREGVQREALAFGFGLLPAGGVRAEPACPASGSGGSGGRSFPRHGEIFRCDRAGWRDAGRRAIELYAPPHRLDEFPAGYSLAGCAPAEPAAASPAGNHYAAKGRRWPSKTSERSTVSKLFVSPQGASPPSALVTPPRRRPRGG